MITNNMNPLKRSLARTILREGRRMPKNDPKIGRSFAAMYDICHSVNPQSEGFHLHSQNDFANFVRKACATNGNLQDFSSMYLLRKNLPEILENFDRTEQNEKELAFHSRPGFITLEKGSKSLKFRCPFELLRAIRKQNEVLETASSCKYNGLNVQVVTGYAPSKSTDQENVFSYNIVFTNEGSESVRLIGQKIQFRNRAGVLTTPNKKAKNIPESVKETDGSKYPQRIDIYSHQKEDSCDYEIGVNGQIPIIGPGEYYVCGNNVAFPQGLRDTDILLDGHFDVITEGERSETFENMALEHKYKLLSDVTEGTGKFKLKLNATKFRFGVGADTQPLREKFPERFVEEREIQA